MNATTENYIDKKFAQTIEKKSAQLLTFYAISSCFLLK
jgi:hypothetical protein